MTLSQHIRDVRVLLREPLPDNAAGRQYTDEEIVAQTDLQHRQLFRTLTYNTKEYHNFVIALRKERARQVFARAYEWRLPTWVSNIAEGGVFAIRGLSGANETGLSPYLWPFVTTMEFDRPIAKKAYSWGITKEQWSWQGSHTLRIENLSAPIDIACFVAKSPPRLIKIKLQSPSEANDVLYLPTGAMKWAGMYDLEEGAYINADLICTSTASGTNRNLGSVARVVHSAPSASVNNTRTHVLYLSETLTDKPEANDVFESLLPVPQDHARYLQLLTANACAQKNNSELLAAIAPDVAKETELFMQYAQAPRDYAGPMQRMIEGQSMIDFTQNKDRSY